MKKRMVSLASVLFILLVGKLFISSAPDERYNAGLGAANINFAELPNHIKFCNERTPLENRFTKKRFDTELGIYVKHKRETLRFIREAKAHFPYIVPILKQYGIPEDFKYLPLVESGFTQQVSEKGAAGPWQFMPTTARVFGLEVNDEIDERYHLEKSTAAACKYLKQSYRIFRNWTLVAASYNFGVPGLKAKSVRDKKDSYYEMDLNSQTSRYVYKLLAYKEVIENPAKYKFPNVKGYSQVMVPAYKIQVDGPIENLRKFAEKHKVSYTDLKKLNPWLRSDRLTNPNGKTYYIRLPIKKELPQIVDAATNIGNVVKLPETILKTANLPAKQNVPVLDTLLYAVKNGENLYSIGKKFGIHENSIIDWNGLKSIKIQPGQLLKIYSTKALENESL